MFERLPYDEGLAMLIYVLMLSTIVWFVVLNIYRWFKERNIVKG